MRRIEHITDRMRDIMVDLFSEVENYLEDRNIIDLDRGYGSQPRNE